jgi:hypothetical protein
MSQVSKLHSISDDRRGPAASRATYLFSHPDEVLTHREIPLAQKRAILASWGSDTRAVEGSPSLRQLDNGAVVTIDEILRALKSLDAIQSPQGPSDLTIRTCLPFDPRRGVPRWLRQAVGLCRFDNDDDDPPPSPVGSASPVRLQHVKADGRQWTAHCSRLATAAFGSGL